MFEVVIVKVFSTISVVSTRLKSVLTGYNSRQQNYFLFSVLLFHKQEANHNQYNLSQSYKERLGKLLFSHSADVKTVRHEYYGYF